MLTVYRGYYSSCSTRSHSTTYVTTTSRRLFISFLFYFSSSLSLQNKMKTIPQTPFNSSVRFRLKDSIPLVNRIVCDSPAQHLQPGLKRTVRAFPDLRIAIEVHLGATIFVACSYLYIIKIRLQRRNLWIKNNENRTWGRSTFFTTP